MKYVPWITLGVLTAMVLAAIAIAIVVWAYGLYPDVNYSGI